MKHIFFQAAFLLPSALCAQPFAIGSTNITFYDAGRDRNVACELHYPANTAGTDVPVTDGSFPVLAIGHGFVMTVDAYTYLWEHFVPLGYIVALPTTEGGFAPVHANFGGDLAFLANTIISSNDDAASPFYQHVLPKAALLGHSMGGGASFLGAANNGNIQALIALAPAETDPSAIASASAVLVPTLVFAASEDCVTPIPEHAGPIYAAINSPCKAFVNITGGGHCYFGDNSFTCSFGELTCGPDLTISREQQQTVVTDIADLWLRYHLLGDVFSYEPLLDSLASSDRFVAETTCLSTPLSIIDQSTEDPSVLVQNGSLLVERLLKGDQVQLVDALGRIRWSGLSASNMLLIDTHDLVAGSYVLVLRGQRATTSQIFVISR